MLQFKRIVCPTDFSEGADQAVSGLGVLDCNGRRGHTQCRRAICVYSRQATSTPKAKFRSGLNDLLLQLLHAIEDRPEMLSAPNRFVQSSTQSHFSEIPSAA
jgi:hypothetical protein